MTQKALRLATALFAALLAVPVIPTAQGSGEVALRAAMETETVKGDLRAAIEQYKKIAAGTDRAIVVRALLRMAECYHKLGDVEAQKIYQQLVREYADQKEAVAIARARLTGSDRAAPVDSPKGSGVAAHHVWTSDFVDGRPSPDGRYLAWVNYPAGLRRGGGGNLAVHDLTTGEDRDVTHHTGDFSFAENPFFAPDGKRMLYAWFDASSNRSELRMINIDGSNERVVAPVGIRTAGVVSPDGTVAAVEVFEHLVSQLALVHLASGRATVLKTVDWRQPQLGNFSPDGRYLVYSMLVQQDSQDRDIYAIAVDGSSETRLVAAPGANRAPFFSPDGRHIVFTSNRSGGRWDLWSLDVSNGKTAREPELLKTDIGSVTNMGFTTNGAFYYLQQLDQQDAYEAEVDPATWKVIGAPRRISDRFVSLSAAPRWSGDGTALAYVARRGGTARYEGADVTFVVRAGGQEREVTAPMRAAENAQFFRWFPDRKSLLLVGYGPLGRAFQRLDLTTGRLTTLFNTRQSSLSVIVSADGRTVLYPITDTNDRTLKHLVRRDLETGEEQNILDARTGGDGSAAFHGLCASPDGRFVAYVAGDSATISIATLATGDVREIWRAAGKFIFPQALSWDADGRGLLATVKNDIYAKTEEVWYVPIDGREPHSIGVAMPEVRVSGVDPDGRRIGFTGGERTGKVWTLTNLFPAQTATK